MALQARKVFGAFERRAQGPKNKSQVSRFKNPAVQDLRFLNRGTWLLFLGPGLTRTRRHIFV